MSPMDSQKKGMSGDEGESNRELSKGARPVAAPVQKFIAEYKVVEKDTLSGIALKYYGTAAEKMWKHIYEANKAVIGAKPEMLNPGMILRIPEKPEG